MRKNSDVDLSLNKVLPSNIEAEQSVLGSCLQENNSINIVKSFLTKDDFYNDAHKKIFSAIIELHEKKESVDLVTLSDALANKGLLDSVGGASYIASLVDDIPSAANVAGYAKIVRDKARLRHAASILNEAVIEVYNANGDGAAPILEKLREKINLIPGENEKRLQFIDKARYGGFAGLSNSPARRGHSLRQPRRIEAGGGTGALAHSRCRQVVPRCGRLDRRIY